MNWFVGDLIERNISKKVFFGICIVGTAIIILDFLFSFISEISDISISYNFNDAFFYSLLLIPGSLYEYLSYICLLGVLIGLGSLKEEGEMIGTRILGKSNFRILIASLKPSLVLIILGFFLQETTLPSLLQSNEENRLIKQNQISSDDGHWFTSDSAITYFKSSPNRQTIKKIKIYELDEEWGIRRIIYSDSATKERDIWNLINSEIINIRDGSKTSEKTLIWESAPSQKDMRKILSPKYLSIRELKGAIDEEVSEYRKNNLTLELWRKIFHPISSLLLIILASSFVFTQVRDQNLGQRLLIGLVFAFSLNIVQSLFESMAVVSFLLPLAAVILPMIFVLAVTIIVWKWKPS